MRPQPLPPGQASVTALLVDRPELARLAQRENVIDYVTDPRLRPILNRVIWAATEGEPMPSEGELLELVDPASHKLVHDCLAPNHEKLSFSNSDDPGAVLRDALSMCRREELHAERARLEPLLAQANRSGDHEAAQTIAKQLTELGIELYKLQPRGRR